MERCKRLASHSQRKGRWGSTCLRRDFSTSSIKVCALLSEFRPPTQRSVLQPCFKINLAGGPAHKIGHGINYFIVGAPNGLVVGGLENLGSPGAKNDPESGDDVNYRVQLATLTHNNVHYGALGDAAFATQDPHILVAHSGTCSLLTTT